ncbi:MAG: Smr/MutS family protein, partial [Leptotrichia hofstadii]
SSELDLRGKRDEEAMKDLELYLDAASLANYPRVTIIHGRGTGAIQQGVHKVLRSHRSVASFEFAPMNTGGNGATIVTFK